MLQPRGQGGEEVGERPLFIYVGFLLLLFTVCYVSRRVANSASSTVNYAFQFTCY